MKDSTSVSKASVSSENETMFIRGMHAFFRLLGRFVARHAIMVIVFCCALTVIGTIKMKRTPRKSDLSGYAPMDARSRVEFEIQQEFFDQQGHSVQVLVMLMAKDNGTMLRKSHLFESVKILDYVTKNFSIYNADSNRNETFDEFCYGFCLYNEPVRQFYNGFLIQSNHQTSRVALHYPITSLFGRKFSLQPNFFGITLYSDKEVNDSLTTKTPILSNIKESKMVVLQFRAERKPSWTDEMVKAYEVSISEYFDKEYKSDKLKVLVVSQAFVQKEIQRGGLKLQPFLGVGFAIMVVFTVITTLISSAFVNQCTWYKILNAVFACVVPFMSCGAAFGMLFFAGVRFGPIILVTPFLILAIGVDDSFLMMHAWQRVVSKLRKHPRPDDSVEYRLAEVLAEAGPSITLSAVTNIAAFIVGALTSPPEVCLFCVTNAFALFVDTCFSLTLYAAIMAVCGRREMLTENEPTEKTSFTDFLHSAKESAYAFLDSYIKFLTNIRVSILIVCAYVVYILVTAYGTSQLGIDLSSRKFFLSDSVLLDADRLRTEYVIPYFTSALIIVNNPGNLSDVDRVHRLNTMVSHFESMNNSIGPDATKYFIRDFQDYKEAMDEAEGETGVTAFNVDDLEGFLAWPEYSYWKGFLKVRNDSKTGEEKLEKFFFLIGFEGQELKDWRQRSELLHSWRNEVDQFKAEFNVSIFYDDAFFLDLIEVIPSVVWQSALATLVCIAVACFIFMFDPFTTVVTSLAITTICLGTFGCLSFWNISQDPIMMAAVIMSIGFSVDIPAHIAFHYYRTGVDPDSTRSIEWRLLHTLAAVGFPVIQAGISTNLCVLSLLMVSMYMSEVFVKSMVLCISLGLLHGLLLMPAIFNLSHCVAEKCRSRRSVRAEQPEIVTVKKISAAPA